MTKPPLFDLIIPTYNNADELITCLNSLERQTLRSFRVIVCIDGSTDETRERLTNINYEFDLIVTEHPNGKNCGRNAARNLALPYLCAPYICFLDSDLHASKGLLEQHYEVLTSSDCVSVGFINYSSLSDNLWARYLERRGRGKYHHQSTIPFNYLVTGNCSMPAEWFTRVGGQDPNMANYGGGDTELAFRLWKQIRPQVKANHKAIAYANSEKTLNQALQDMYRFGNENLPYLVEKHPESRFLYFFEHVTANELKGILIRKLLHPIMLNLKNYIGYLPLWLQFQVINYLVLVAIYSGYYDRQPDQL